MKACNTDQLRSLNDLAMRKRFYVAIAPPVIDALDPSGLHLVRVVADHGDGQSLRCSVLAQLTGKVEPAAMNLDIRHNDYARLTDAPGA